MNWLDLLAGLVSQMQAPPPEQRFDYQVLPELPARPGVMERLDPTTYLPAAYPERQPTDSERTFFQGRPTVAGYAAPDNAVVLNPFGVTADNEAARLSVLANERTRLYLREHPEALSAFDVLPYQQERLGQDYANDLRAQQQTIAARIFAGDPSLAPYSALQQQAAQNMWTRPEQPKRAAPGARWILENSGDISESSLDAVPWVDMDYPTQSGDLRALTLKAKGGTSEGDAWGLPDVYAARHIVGSDMSIQPRHVQAYKQYLLDQRAPHFMSTHEGKAAY